MKYLVIVCFLFSINLFAQDSTWHEGPDTNTVIVHKDLRLDLLIQKQIEINEVTSREARRIARGFRLLVINTAHREEAIQAKTKVYNYFPELKSYLIYQAPYFKLKAGNFKEQKDAEDYLEKMKKYFPKGVYIMRDIIEVKLDSDDESL